jgi:hypothetical protein
MNYTSKISSLAVLVSMGFAPSRFLRIVYQATMQPFVVHSSAQLMRNAARRAQGTPAIVGREQRQPFELHDCQSE